MWKAYSHTRRGAPSSFHVCGSGLSFSRIQCKLPVLLEERFSLSFFDVAMQSPLLGWGTVQSCLIRYNNAEISVRIGNRSSCLFRYNKTEFSVWDGEAVILPHSTFINESTIETVRVWESESEESVSIHHSAFSIVHSAFKNLTFDQSNFWYTFQNDQKSTNNQARSPPEPPQDRPRAILGVRWFAQDPPRHSFSKVYDKFDGYVYVHLYFAKF